MMVVLTVVITAVELVVSSSKVGEGGVDASHLMKVSAYANRSGLSTSI